MKVAVTKTFANYVDKLVKELNLGTGAQLMYVGPMEYPGGIPPFNMDAELDRVDPDEVDYDGVDCFKVIKVYYKAEDWAVPVCISTPMLNRMMKSENVIDEASLRAALRNLIEI